MSASECRCKCNIRNDGAIRRKEKEMSAAGDLFVSDFCILAGRAGEPPVIYMIWPEGIPALLPPADMVLFVRRDLAAGGEVAAFAEWRRVFDTVGGMMKLQEEYPQRSRVDEIPSCAPPSRATGCWSRSAAAPPPASSPWRTAATTLASSSTGSSPSWRG